MSTLINLVLIQNENLSPTKVLEEGEYLLRCSVKHHVPTREESERREETED